MNEKWRQKLHLEPVTGWLNDPNGLSYYNGAYHVYFQYAKDSAMGEGDKCWGHYQSKDLINWEFTGTVIFPDTPYDKNGAYSGSAYVFEDKLLLFYTGNVKEEGEHDYIKSGRGANVIMVSTTDGHHMSEKKLLLENQDYPDFCSCHVRDPKIYTENGETRMILGARTLEDKGCVLIYTSKDLLKWQYKEMLIKEDFGYMWECPDMIFIDGHKYLSVSPQGLKKGKAEYQNVYSSGYFFADENKLENFTEWDYGFDFYAPQTFTAPDKRVILIGWMGIGDIPYVNKTVESGWQHSLTLPRVVMAGKNGVLLQNPVEELENLRKKAVKINSGETISTELPFDYEGKCSDKFQIRFENILDMKYDGNMFSLVFLNEDAGGGRDVRNTVLDKCENIRIIADTSGIEIYLDNGRRVLSSRFYPEDNNVQIYFNGCGGNLYPMNGMEVKILGE